MPSHPPEDDWNEGNLLEVDARRSFAVSPGVSVSPGVGRSSPDGIGTVAATDDTDRIAVGDCLGDRFGSLVHGRLFKNTHRSIPDNGLCVANHFSIVLSRLRPNVQAFHAIGNLTCQILNDT